jgi:predicted DCC family thiol-disulfide oxidoreductase YuxK
MAVRLYVLYDGSCGLCSHLVQWMSGQPTSFELVFMASGSDGARRLFPEFPMPARPEELVVISGDGSVYRGDAAYIVCLYALDNFRTLAVRLARPGFRGMARRLFSMVSTNRVRLSELLGLRPDDAISRAVLGARADALDGREGPAW